MQGLHDGIMPPHEGGISAMRTFRLIYILIAFGFVPKTSLLAQSAATRGVIEGTVRSEDGSPLPAVSVTITNQDDGTERRIQTRVMKSSHPTAAKEGERATDTRRAAVAESPLLNSWYAVAMGSLCRPCCSG